MTEMRLWIGGILLWMLLLFNVERFHEPINIASFVYIMAALVAVLIVLVRGVRRLPFGWVYGASLVIMLALKAALHYRLLGANLPLTITESFALLVTTGLAWRLGRSIDHFEEAATHVVTMQRPETLRAFDEKQSEFYREIRRAREFHRPATLLAVGPHPTSRRAETSPLLQRMQQRLIHQYVIGQLAELLTRESRDCDLVAQRDDHLLLLFPESDGRDVDQLLARVRAKVEAELGVDICTGAATFPEQEVTLSGLLRRAVQNLHDSRQAPDGSRSSAGRSGQIQVSAIHHEPAPFTNTNSVTS